MTHQTGHICTRQQLVANITSRMTNYADKNEAQKAAAFIVTGMMYDLVQRNSSDLNIQGDEVITRASEFDVAELAWLITDPDYTKLLGFVILHQGTNESTKHVASLRLAVDFSAWNMGIGSTLIQFAVQKAPEYGITRLEASPYTPLNPWKYHLFIDKGGFEIEGVKKNAVKKDGEYVDVLSLVRFFK